jgi:hypothetical protein
MKWFSHSGDLGDILYSLPTIRAAGGGKLILFDYPGRTAHGMTREKVERLRPLLEMQDYIHRLEWSDSKVDSSLNGFRDHCRDQGNIIDAHLATHGLDWTHRETQWIHVDESRSPFAVLFARSQRYNNSRFPWQRIADKYRDIAGFVGTAKEHEVFCGQFGFVPFVAADDFLQLARLIAGCKLFVCNQSAPGALSHGLFQSMIIELCPHNYRLGALQRMNCVNGFDGRIDLPDITEKEFTNGETQDSS